MIAPADADRPPTRWKRLASYTGTALLVLAVVFAVMVATGWLRITPVLSGSMRPAFNPGDAVLTSRVDSGSLHIGDIVVLHTPRQYGGGQIVHRVVTVDHSGGATIVSTRGDANNVADPWHAVLPAQVYRVRAVLPYVGWIHDVKTRGGLLTLLAILAVVLLSLGVRRLMTAGRRASGHTEPPQHSTVDEPASGPAAEVGSSHHNPVTAG